MVLPVGLRLYPKYLAERLQNLRWQEINHNPATIEIQKEPCYLQETGVKENVRGRYMGGA